MSIRVLLLIGTLIVSAALLPTRSVAQAKERIVDVRKAESLEARASELATDIGTFKKAAKLYRSAAALRPEGDAVAVQDLVAAARLLFYRKDVDTAYGLMVEAAESAARIGDVYTAAYAFADAVHIAIARADGRAAQNNLYRARLLSLSPLLTDAQHASLTQRLGSVATVVANREQER